MPTSKDDHVQLLFSISLEHVFGILGLADDGVMEMFAENLFDAMAYHGVIIDDQNFHGDAGILYLPCS